LSDLEWCKLKESVNFEATSNNYVDVDCDVIATEYPTDGEIIQTIKRGADIDCEMLEDDCSEKLPSVGVRDAISAFETVKSYTLAQENANYDIICCIRCLENFCSSRKRNSCETGKNNGFS
jgi:hypothetical protein